MMTHCKKAWLLTLFTFLFLGLMMGSALAADAAINGVSWLDRNNNGKIDGSENALTGVKVTLEKRTDAGTEEVSTKTVDRDGNFSFSVSAGTYRLRAEMQRNNYFTLYGGDSSILPAQKNKGYTPYFTVEKGDTVTKNIGGSTAHCSVSLIAYEDVDSNGGRRSSEPLIKGVKAELLFEYNGKTLVVASSTSDRDGNASIWEVSPGTYRLRVTLPSHYVIGPKGEKNSLYYNRINPAAEEGMGYSDPFKLEAKHTVSMAIGCVKTGSLEGSIWLDSNFNGKKDSGETACPSGVSVTLTAASSDLKRTVAPNSKGNYEFNGLQPGNYTLTVTLPDGMVFTYPGASLISEISTTGTAKASVKVDKTTTMDPIGIMPAAKLAVKLFADANGNGKQDAGEKAVSGVTVAVTQNGKKIASKKTDSGGVVHFSALRSGSAQVACRLPSGYIFLDKGSNGAILPADTLSTSMKLDGSGKEAVWSAAVSVPGSIGGMLFENPQNTGLYSGDCTLLSGFTVQAVDGKGNVIAKSSTGKDGQYTLSPLPAGDYTVRFLLNDPYVASPATEHNSIVSQTPAYGESGVWHIKQGEKVSHVDGAVFRAGVVEGVVKNALSKGGVRGITATLLDDQGAPVSDYTYGITGNDGRFTIKGVLPGTYSVQYTLTEDAAFTDPDTDSKEYVTDSFSMSSGSEVTLKTLSAVYTANLSGTVSKADGSGVQGTVILSNDEVTHETALQPDGSYAFIGVRPGKYQLQVTLPEGYVFGHKGASPLGPLPNNVATAAITLNMEDRTVINAYAALPVNLSGTLFYDANQSGVQDKKEEGAAGRIMTLWMNKVLISEVYTDDQGTFRAEHLVPGNYVLRLALEDNEAVVGDFAQKTSDGVELLFSLQEDAAFTLPLMRYGAIAGSVWNLDGSGNQVSGISVTLVNAKGETIATKTTGKKGAYSFSGLLPGKYSLKAELPDGFLFAREQDTQKHSSYIQSQTGGDVRAVTIQLPMGEKMTGIDIGMGAMGKIGDYAWLDTNGNGMQDIGEDPMPGIKIELYQHGKLAASTTTDVYGRYSLENLYPGEYEMKVTMHKELKATKHQTKFPLVASVLPEKTGTTVTAKIIVPSGGENLHCDLGFQLRKKGTYPSAMKKTPTKDWTPYSDR